MAAEHQFKSIKALSTYQFSCHSVGKKHLASLSVVGMKGGCRVCPPFYLHAVYPSVFFHLTAARSQGQQLKHSSPELPLIRHFLQLIQVGGLRLFQAS